MSETPPPRIARTTLAASFGFALVQLDVTIVNVALPTIAHTLGVGVSGLQWVVDAYAIAFAALLLTGGFLGDRFGAKRLYFSGMALFAAASLGCGLAPDGPVLIVSRIVQGFGAAIMLPCSLTLINHAAQGHPQARAQAVGWWTAAGSITIAAGPILGGLLVGAGNWRLIFLINLPVCALGAWLTMRVDETGKPPASRGFDLKGQLLGVVALTALTAAVIEVKPQGLASGIVPALAVLALLAGWLFIRQERRSTDPMLPMGLFAHAEFSGAVAYGAIVNLTYYGAVFVLSLYLQSVLGYSPVEAGLAFLPLTATFFGVNILSGWWVGRSGSRGPMIAGALIDAGGFALLAILAGADARFLMLLPAFLLLPGGMGLGVPAMTTAVLTSVPRERAGTASAVLNAARQAAGAMGVAIFGSLAGDENGHIVRGLHIASLLAVALLVGVAILSMRLVGRRTA